MNAGHFWGSDILVRWLWWAVAGDPHLVNKTTSSRTILTRFQAVLTRAARQWDSLAQGCDRRTDVLVIGDSHSFRHMTISGNSLTVSLKHRTTNASLEYTRRRIKELGIVQSSFNHRDRLLG